jgi:hypothetical protein
MLEWGKVLAEASWPLVILVVALIFRQSIKRWLDSTSKVSIGPVELTRDLEKLATASRQVLKDTTKLQILSAESRVIEMEVFLSYPILTEEQTAVMKQNIEKLREEIRKLELSQA